MCNHYSLELRTYLHFGDSVFLVILQVTANVTVSLVATSPTLFSFDWLGNRLLSDHAQAYLLSARSERHYFVSWRIFLSFLQARMYMSQATKPSSHWNTAYSYWASLTSTTCSVLFQKKNKLFPLQQGSTSSRLIPFILSATEEFKMQARTWRWNEFQYSSLRYSQCS